MKKKKDKKLVSSVKFVNFIFKQMKALDDHEIDVATANAQANLAKQTCKFLEYDLNKAKFQFQLKRCCNDMLNEVEVDKKS